MPMFIVENTAPPEKRKRTQLVTRYMVVADTTEAAIVSAIRFDIAAILETQDTTTVPAYLTATPSARRRQTFAQTVKLIGVVVAMGRLLSVGKET